MPTSARGGFNSRTSFWPEQALQKPLTFLRDTDLDLTAALLDGLLACTGSGVESQGMLHQHLFYLYLTPPFLGKWKHLVVLIFLSWLWVFSLAMMERDYKILIKDTVDFGAECWVWICPCVSRARDPSKKSSASSVHALLCTFPVLYFSY